MTYRNIYTLNRLISILQSFSVLHTSHGTASCRCMNTCQTRYGVSGGPNMATRNFLLCRVNRLKTIWTPLLESVAKRHTKCVSNSIFSSKYDPAAVEKTCPLTGLDEILPTKKLSLSLVACSFEEIWPEEHL